MRRALLLAALALLLGAGSAAAQKNCRKGIPCGNTCISATKTCRTVTPASAPATAATAAVADTLTSEVEEAPWVASSRGTTYYRNGCSTARRLSPANRIYFQSEEEAERAGYRRSRSKGC